MSQRVAVNPELLHWALARAGVSADTLTGKFPKLRNWLAGELMPTLKQLEAFAAATHTAIGLMFLSEPPDEPLPIHDFRTMPEAVLARPSADLLDTIYLCQQRQAWYRNYQRIQGTQSLAFVGSATRQDSIIETAQRIAQTIGFSTAERQRLPNWSEALRRFIALVEQSGVLVMISGVVGSNTHRPLNPQEFRGFALVDPLAPLIFVNGKDSKAAQMFTLAHELAHLWLGESGISDVQAANLPNEAVERWCNAVAAELLVPLARIRESYRPGESLDEAMQRLAGQFKVSTLVILRRLHDLGVIDRETLWDTYREELERLKALSRKTGGGGDFYNSLGARVSKRFASSLVASTLEGQTPFTEAFRMLGIRKSATFYEEARRLGLHG
ncbi:ImmA/IrrE family metallo-endopeptidase [Acidihalobacter ferrooxydans]|uniref:DNA-binding protein n=1 Tax=Acidihalobacter ferrooxydans TaxID=1765967 RepID=A0A1P8UFB4_9GAMM|nr:ImmA/IrrE family metallo-endopeptidase [Acidihalobacter ferrooxydans]APZ42526.1 DNA-binding protein [Acidihalobacter ferrooxydans]